MEPEKRGKDRTGEPGKRRPTPKGSHEIAKGTALGEEHISVSFRAAPMGRKMETGNRGKDGNGEPEKRRSGALENG
ncbi:MAG: hypothetical protein D6681_10665 [Calditrichaeota bacterium]|nr:MAG: hypothetical protein D6681_10665 [Calditrichota bacterium]